MENRTLFPLFGRRHTPPCPSWTNTLPRHFRRGPASHKLFDFLPSIYPFYMFLAAKTFSVHRRVRNYYTKRTLNLTLNRGKILEAGKRDCRQTKPRHLYHSHMVTCEAPSRRCFPTFISSLPQNTIRRSCARHAALALLFS